jgi:hypothetical protein
MKRCAAGNAKKRTGKKRLSGVALVQALRERRKRLGNETEVTGMRRDEADSMKRR